MAHDISKMKISFGVPALTIVLIFIIGYLMDTSAANAKRDDRIEYNEKRQEKQEIIQKDTNRVVQTLHVTSARMEEKLDLLIQLRRGDRRR